MPVIKVTLEIDLTEGDQNRLLGNSIERVMNNAIHVGSEVQNIMPSDSSLHDRGSTLWQDCEELKMLVHELWSAAAEAVRKERYKNQK